MHTRAGSKHDLFNALCWLAFPRTKARINALHAREIPKEGGKRGPLRDLLTIFDEGGAIVVGDEESEQLVRSCQWQELFVEKPKFKIVVLGHAVLEQALEPYPGITCKVIFARSSEGLDAHCAAWLATRGASPRDLPPVPIMGYPGWYPGNDKPGFLADGRYFRPSATGRNAAAR